MKKIITTISVAILLLLVAGCSNKEGALTHLNDPIEEQQLIIPPNLQN